VNIDDEGRPSAATVAANMLAGGIDPAAISLKLDRALAPLLTSHRLDKHAVRIAAPDVAEVVRKGALVARYRDEGHDELASALLGAGTRTRVAHAFEEAPGVVLIGDESPLRLRDYFRELASAARAHTVAAVAE
jgi:hypothetical protein